MGKCKSSNITILGIKTEKGRAEETKPRTRRESVSERQLERRERKMGVLEKR